MGLAQLKLKLDMEELGIAEYNQFTIVDGLTNNILYAVYPDDYDNLWITSDYGLIQYNLLNKSFKAYTLLDGLPINEFNTKGKEAHTVICHLSKRCLCSPGSLLFNGGERNDRIYTIYVID